MMLTANFYEAPYGKYFNLPLKKLWSETGELKKKLKTLASNFRYLSFFCIHNPRVYKSAFLKYNCDTVFA